MRGRHFLAVVTAAALWGTGGLFGSLLAAETPMSAAAVAWWRVAIAGLALMVLVLATGQWRVDRWSAVLVRRIMLTGVLVGAFQALYFTAVAAAGVALTTVVAIGSAPIWVAVVDLVTSRTWPSRRTIVAGCLAISGLVVLLAGSVDPARASTRGVVVALMVGAVFAGITVTNRTQVKEASMPTVTAASFVVATVLLAPMAWAAGWAMPTTTTGWLWATALGVVSTGLAYLAFFAGLATVPPFVAAVLTLVEPAVAATLGVLLLSEQVGAWGTLGAVALAAAVVVLRPQRDVHEEHAAPPTMVQDP